MDKQLECTKIKDGLYIGNFRTAQDAEFLVTNKFTYVVNCSLETPNYYEGQGIKYLKFKLGRDKPHKLWDESLKKLKKLDKFIQTCEQNSMCCLVHSFDGVNRSLVMLVAFLMNRYRWCLSKTLEFIRSKQIFIGLSQHYIEQLEKLQQILNKTEPKLSTQWRKQYDTIEQQIISKTYLNSLQVQYKQKKGEKKERRIMWKDLVEKEKRKELKQQQKKARVVQNNPPRVQNNINETYLSKKYELNKNTNDDDLSDKIKKQAQKKNAKLGTIKSKAQICFEYTQEQNGERKQLEEESVFKKPARYSYQKESKMTVNEQKDEEDQILKLIKKNLKVKRKNQANVLDCTNDQYQEKIYNVTINNFIKPNINILNNPKEDKREKGERSQHDKLEKSSKAGKDKKKQTKQRPSSAWGQSNKDKINRTMSQKQGIRSNNLNIGKQKSLKSMVKKNIDHSPRRKDITKKNQKTVSLYGAKS